MNHENEAFDLLIRQAEKQNNEEVPPFRTVFKTSARNAQSSEEIMEQFGAVYDAAKAKSERGEFDFVVAVETNEGNVICEGFPFEPELVPTCLLDFPAKKMVCLVGQGLDMPHHMVLRTITMAFHENRYCKIMLMGYDSLITKNLQDLLPRAMLWERFIPENPFDVEEKLAAVKKYAKGHFHILCRKEWFLPDDASEEEKERERRVFPLHRRMIVSAQDISYRCDGEGHAIEWYEMLTDDELRAYFVSQGGESGQVLITDDLENLSDYAVQINWIEGKSAFEMLVHERQQPVQKERPRAKNEAQVIQTAQDLMRKHGMSEIVIDGRNVFYHGDIDDPKTAFLRFDLSGEHLFIEGTQGIGSARVPTFYEDWECLLLHDCMLDSPENRRFPPQPWSEEAFWGKLQLTFLRYFAPRSLHDLLHSFGLRPFFGGSFESTVARVEISYDNQRCVIVVDVKRRGGGREIRSIPNSCAHMLFDDLREMLTPLSGRYSMRLHEFLPEFRRVIPCRLDCTRETQTSILFLGRAGKNLRAVVRHFFPDPNVPDERDCSELYAYDGKDILTDTEQIRTLSQAQIEDILACMIKDLSKAPGDVTVTLRGDPETLLAEVDVKGTEKT